MNSFRTIALLLIFLSVCFTGDLFNISNVLVTFGIALYIATSFKAESILKPILFSTIYFLLKSYLYGTLLGAKEFLYTAILFFSLTIKLKCSGKENDNFVFISTLIIFLGALYQIVSLLLVNLHYDIWGLCIYGYRSTNSCELAPYLFNDKFLYRIYGLSLEPSILAGIAFILFFTSIVRLYIKKCFSIENYVSAILSFTIIILTQSIPFIIGSFVVFVLIFGFNEKNGILKILLFQFIFALALGLFDYLYYDGNIIFRLLNRLTNLLSMSDGSYSLRFGGAQLLLKAVSELSFSEILLGAMPQYYYHAFHGYKDYYVADNIMFYYFPQDVNFLISSIYFNGLAITIYLIIKTLPRVERYDYSAFVLVLFLVYISKSFVLTGGYAGTIVLLRIMKDAYEADAPASSNI